MAEQTLNVPSLLFLIVITSLAIKFFFLKDRTGSIPTSHHPDPAHITQISSMFPQVEPREIAWDLFRNGGNVQATTERILSGARLDMPPPSFQPQLPTTSTTPAAAPTEDLSKPIDLITRYNLGSKIASASGTSQQLPTQSHNSNTWAQNRNERQMLLLRRRDEMVLMARKRMEESSKPES